VTQLRATISQVRCSSCGAPVQLGGASACSHCGAPISILDADAVKRTLAQLSAADQKSRHYDPTAAVDGLLAGKRIERRIAQIERGNSGRGESNVAAGVELVDLVSDALDFLMRD